MEQIFYNKVYLVSNEVETYDSSFITPVFATENIHYAEFYVNKANKLFNKLHKFYDKKHNQLRKKGFKYTTPKGELYDVNKYQAAQKKYYEKEETYYRRKEYYDSYFSISEIVLR